MMFLFFLAVLSVLGSAYEEESVAWWNRRRRHKPNAYVGGKNIGEGCWNQCGGGGLCNDFCGGAFCCRYGVEDGDGVCDGTIGDPNNQDHHVCWEGKNVGQNCWEDCDGSGICEHFCGGNGACCKFGLDEDNGVCDGTIGDENNKDHHVCWPAPKNINEQCWWNCGEKGGVCTNFCGAGMCCRYGNEEDNGCDGAMGDPNQEHHVCSSVAPKKENDFCRKMCMQKFKGDWTLFKMCLGSYEHNGKNFGGCSFENGSNTACSKSCKDAGYVHEDKTNACDAGCAYRFPCADGYTFKKDDVWGNGYKETSVKNCQECAALCTKDDGKVTKAADVFEGEDAKKNDMCKSYECTAHASGSSCRLNAKASGGGKAVKNQVFCQKMTIDAVEVATKTDTHKGIVATMADGIQCTAYSKKWGYLQMDQTRCNGIPSYIMVKFHVKQLLKDVLKDPKFECGFIKDWSFMFGCPKGVCTLEQKIPFSLDACDALKWLFGGALTSAMETMDAVMKKFMPSARKTMKKGVKDMEKTMAKASNQMENMAKALDKSMQKKMGAKNVQMLKNAGKSTANQIAAAAADPHGESLEKEKFGCQKLEDDVRGILGCFGVNFGEGKVPGLSKVIEVANNIMGRIMFIAQASIVFVIDKLSLTYGMGFHAKWELSVLQLVTRSVLTLLGKFVLDPKNAPGCDKKDINKVAWATSFKFELLPKFSANLVIKCRPATFFGITPAQMGKALMDAKDLVVKKFGEVRDFVVDKIKQAWAVYGDDITRAVDRLKEAAKKFYHIYTRYTNPRFLGMKLVNGVLTFVNSPAGQAAKEMLGKGFEHAKWAYQNPQAAMAEINKHAQEHAQYAKDMAIWARNNPHEARKLAVQKLQQGFDSVIHNGGKAIKFITGPTVQALKAEINRHHKNLKRVGAAIHSGAMHAANQMHAGAMHAADMAADKARDIGNHIKNWGGHMLNRFGGRRHLSFDEETLLAIEHFDAEEYLQLIELTEAGYEEELAYEFSREERLAEVEEFLSEQQYFHSNSLMMSEVRLSEDEQKLQEEAFIEGIMEVADHHVMQQVMAEAAAEEEVAEEIIIPEEEWTEQELNEELLEELLARLIANNRED